MEQFHLRKSFKTSQLNAVIFKIGSRGIGVVQYMYIYLSLWNQYTQSVCEGSYYVDNHCEYNIVLQLYCAGPLPGNAGRFSFSRVAACSPDFNSMVCFWMALLYNRTLFSTVMSVFHQ